MRTTIDISRIMKKKLTDNSCAFSILEQGYREYIENVLRKYAVA